MGDGSGDARALDPATQTAAMVREYLRAHPNFLIENPDLLGILTPPTHQQGNGVVDMQRFMVERLREENATLRLRERALLSTGKNNLASQGRIQLAVLGILNASSLETLISSLGRELAGMLEVDFIALCMEAREDGPESITLPGIRIISPGSVTAWLGESELDVLMVCNTMGDPGLFGEQAEDIRSFALLRMDLGVKTPPGLLVLGSKKPEDFHPDLDTQLIEFLARVLEINIRKWLGNTV